MRLADRCVHLIGDDAQHNVAVQTLLAQHNSTLHTYGWEPCAVAKFAPDASADIILLDPLLPAKVSQTDIFWAMYHAVRITPALTRVPVVAMSYADPITVIPYLREAGFRGFLRKPLNHARFASQLADVLDGKQVWEYR